MWICCQLGAREHYSVPRALHSQNQLGLLVTDVWTEVQSISGVLTDARSKGRFHPDLLHANLASWNWRYRSFELSLRLRRKGWDRILARNDWFQSRALSALRTYRDTHPNQNTVLFAYSYAARKLFEFARQEGWPTVLGQIDGGIGEERFVGQIQRNLSGYQTAGETVPGRYWDEWREECALADHIVVNSDWSRNCLTGEGIDAGKLETIPLAYEPPAEAQVFTREFPVRFTPNRPLRVLFLGQIIVRKGVTAIFEALDKLKGEPVEFRMVGPVGITLPEGIQNHPQIKWVGPVPRSHVTQEYQRADIFLFPTFSDGFGITQLEAQAWKLPVIASKNCGQVVRNLENGYILPDVKPCYIVSAIRSVLENPGRLEMMSRDSCLTPSFTLDNLAARLAGLTENTRDSVGPIQC